MKKKFGGSRRKRFSSEIWGNAVWGEAFKNPGEYLVHA